MTARMLGSQDHTVITVRVSAAAAQPEASVSYAAPSPAAAMRRIRRQAPPSRVIPAPSPYSVLAPRSGPLHQ